MLCVTAVSIVLVVGIACGMDESETLGVDERAMLVCSGSTKVDAMASITLISVVLGLRVMCTASLVERVALSINPLVSSVSLTSESKLSCGQCLMKF